MMRPRSAALLGLLQAMYRLPILYLLVTAEDLGTMKTSTRSNTLWQGLPTNRVSTITISEGCIAQPLAPVTAASDPLLFCTFMAPQDPQTAALLAHIVTQIEQNVNFLASQDYISQNDASSILTKLPNVANNPSPNGINGLAERVSNMTVQNPSTPTRSPAPAPPARSTLPQVKALWAYSGDVRDQTSK